MAQVKEVERQIFGEEEPFLLAKTKWEKAGEMVICGWLTRRRAKSFQDCDLFFKAAMERMK